MKIEIKDVKETPVNVMRKIGYRYQRNEGQEMSFVRPLARQGYPRFHAYTTLTDRDLVISIHLDQKKETYGNAGRHHGEYEDDGALGIEVKRIKEIIG